MKIVGAILALVGPAQPELPVGGRYVMSRPFTPEPGPVECWPQYGLQSPEPWVFDRRGLCVVVLLGRTQSQVVAWYHSTRGWGVDGPGADVDANGFVNGDDFDAFSVAWVQGCDCADFDGNGFVNGDDFDAFAGAWNKGTGL